MSEPIDLEYTYTATPPPERIYATENYLAALRAEVAKLRLDAANWQEQFLSERRGALALQAELDAANRRVEINHQSIDNVLAANKSQEQVIADMNRKIVRLRERAERAEQKAERLRKAMEYVAYITPEELPDTVEYIRNALAQDKPK